MGEEVRITFPVLTWAVYNCKFCKYRGKAEQAREGPELGTKISHAELMTRAGDCSRLLYSSRGGECLIPFFFFNSFIYLFILLFIFLAALGLRCCTGFYLVVASGGHSLVAVLRLLDVVVSHIAEHRL